LPNTAALNPELFNNEPTHRVPWSRLRDHDRLTTTTASAS
jgi:hypothetical protein